MQKQQQQRILFPNPELTWRQQCDQCGKDSRAYGSRTPTHGAGQSRTGPAPVVREVCAVIQREVKGEQRSRESERRRKRQSILAGIGEDIGAAGRDRGSSSGALAASSGGARRPKRCETPSGRIIRSAGV